MANYQNIVNACRAATPTGKRFIHGRLIDFSQSYSGAYPLITLLPFTITDARGTSENRFDSTPLLIGFWKEDRPDTTPEEREALIVEMDELSDTFLNSLLQRTDLQITSILKEPQYQMYQGTLSGFAVSFNLNILAPC